MKRLLLNDLVRWKNRKDRKPLLLRGARQVGKTWLLKAFGKKYFKNYFHLDCERDAERLRVVFNEDLSPETILRNLSLFLNRPIDIRNDLLIFDEIQNIPRALTALKYFYEDMPQLAVCAAGSLLGVMLSDISFPVGKVEFIDVYPLTLEEFILNGDNPVLYDQYIQGARNGKVSEGLHLKLLEALKTYYVTGGMPEVVDAYLKNKKETTSVIEIVRKKQAELILAYNADFNKHAGKVNALHIASVYKMTALQLAQNMDGSVKRFRFKNVIKGKKGYTELRGPIDWLENARLVAKVPIVNRAQLPLKAFCRENIFKLYLNDVGLLGAMLEIPPAAILLSDYEKGFFVENFVASQLLPTLNSTLYGWQERNSEIEFLLIMDDRIIPLEVKAGHRTKAKSLQQYIRKYQPQSALILSLNKFGSAYPKRNIPLYYAGKLREIVAAG